jgi:GNAT superfamily N-acetyltransferase
MATLADVDVIAANNLAMAAETEGLQLDPKTVRSGVRRVVIDEERGLYYLAQRGGQVIGQLLITREWSDWRDDWFWWIQSVYVVPAARGAGVYRTLHGHVEQKARQTPGVCGLRLYVDRSNTVARQVYLQLGLRETNYEFMELAWKGLPSCKTPARDGPAPAAPAPGKP